MKKITIKNVFTARVGFTNPLYTTLICNILAR